MLLQAALNGPFTKADHPMIPMSAEELARDAAQCVAAGAGAIHLHPRDREGNERLDPEVVDSVVSVVRRACGVPVGVSTGAWIEPDLPRRLELIRHWTEPDYASVNVCEQGSSEVAQALLEAGVAIEAGVWTPADARALADWKLHHGLLRVLVEPVEVSPADVHTCVRAIHAALDESGIGAGRLQHGDGKAAWLFIDDAVETGRDTRVGFEDTQRRPDGGRASSNAELVNAAADRFKR